MGIYVNPDNTAFQSVVRTNKYVDKTEMIRFTNDLMCDFRPLICFTRPRRFGKSIAANMLSAYYSKGCDSRAIFEKLNIAQADSFERELNSNTVIHIDAQEFWTYVTRRDGSENVVKYMQSRIIEELQAEFSGILNEDEADLPRALSTINSKTQEKFVIIIDEWDCLFREAKDNQSLQDEYINLLRGLFKSKSSDAFIKLAYITGILPIKKYGTQSALNNFREFTMVKPGKLAEYVGFTEQEVISLCERYDMDFEECKRWYDGYRFNGIDSVYSPNSVMEAMDSGEFDSYWTDTETYESLLIYIDMDFDDIRSAIVSMLAGESVKIDPKTFQNDLKNIKSRDDVMTLLVHLGYLAYDGNKKSVYIPNEEVRQEIVRATKKSSREELTKVIKNSDALLDATLRMDSDEVAKRIEEAHQYHANSQFYNNEQALRMVIMLAYISRVDDYCVFQELPSGKGYADILFFPQKASDKPALLIELKWNQSSGGAIEQIKEKGYCEAIKNYGGDILLVGINYDEKSKEHTCKIEKYEMK